MFEEFINTYGVELIYAVLTTIAGYVAVVVKRLVTNYLNDKTKRAVAKSVVQFVEQVYKDLHGKEKLNAALAAFSEMLAEKGITISDLEMRMLIEAAVAEFNCVFAKPLDIEEDSTIVEGIAVEDMDDDQLRCALQQMGYGYTETMTREEMLATLDEEAAE